MDDLKKESTSLRLDHEPPRSRRGAWVVIAVLVFMVAAGTIFWWGGGVRLLRPVRFLTMFLWCRDRRLYESKGIVRLGPLGCSVSS